MKATALRAIASLATLLTAGCIVPRSDASGSSGSFIAVATITTDGWFSMEMPVCKGDREVYVGAYPDAPRTDGRIGNKLEGRAADSSILTFVVNPAAIATGSMTDQLPIASDNMPYVPVPETLNDAGVFFASTSRGYIEEEFAANRKQTGWKPGERWTWESSGGRLGPGEFRPFEPGDEQVLADYCANALAAEAAR
jgi:hypothetical protein